MYSSTSALQSAYSRAPSFWESQNMDNTTLDFFPSRVQPLMPFLAFLDRRESMALNLPLVLFRSLFSIVLCWLQREVRPDRTELVLELSDWTIGSSSDSTSCNSSSVSLSKSEGSLVPVRASGGGMESWPLQSRSSCHCFGKVFISATCHASTTG